MKPSGQAWQKVLESFAVEHRDHVGHLERFQSEVASGKVSAETLSDCKRALHSLKGTARLLQFRVVEQLAHCGEELLAQQTLPDPIWLQRLREAIEDEVSAALDGRTSASAHQFLQQLAHQTGHALAEAETEVSTVTPIGLGPVIRVPVVQLERFFHSAAHLSKQPGRVQEYLRQLTDLEAQLPNQLQARVKQMRRGLERCYRELHDSAIEMRESARRLTLVPARDLWGGLASQVRELAHQRGKQVDFSSEGLDTLVELPLAQALLEPLNHLLGNSLSHGIESPQEREAAGKSATGRVELRVYRRAEELVVTLVDDGRGLDHSRLQQRAEELGVYRGQAAEELIFLEGLSSAQSTDLLAGRGVGMAAVKTRIAELGGRLRLSGQPGLTVEMHFPSGFWGALVLMVQAGSQWFALPANEVRGVRRLNPEVLIQDPDGTRLLENGRTRPVIRLSSRLQLAARPTSDYAVELDDVFLAVDALGSLRDAIVQPVPRAGWPDELLEGAFMLGSGEVCMLLKPSFLLQDQPKPSRSERQDEAATVLVVDDSATTRQLTVAILQAEGFRTIQAEDGRDALDKFSKAQVDAVISDIQMPHLDGLGLLAAIRSGSHNRDVPVLLLTSLMAPDEQRRGLDSGADAYLLKQNFDHRRLLETLRRFL